VPDLGENLDGKKVPGLWIRNTARTDKNLSSLFVEYGNVYNCDSVMQDRYGEIEEMNVCDNLGDHLVGNVYIKFKYELDAESVRLSNYFTVMPLSVIWLAALRSTFCLFCFVFVVPRKQFCRSGMVSSYFPDPADILIGSVSPTSLPDPYL
jgi:uncharacterized protein YuzB (UPF0349 family)